MVDISFSDFTSGSMAGNGYYDILMRVNKEHIKEEYDSGRITGADYATVYLGLLQSAMQSALEFSVREKEVESKLELDNTKVIMDAVAQYGYNSAAVDISGQVILGTRSADGILNKQETLADAQINEMEARELATKAKILDENGIEITAENELVPSASTTTAHHFSTDLLKAQIATEEEKDDLVKAQKDAALMDSVAKRGQITQELNGEYNPTTLEWAFPGASVDTNEEINFYKSVSGANVATPYTMNMFRQLKENSIADATAKGYKADGAYKAYKSLQELLFALANAGVEASDEDIIAGTANNPYKKIMLSMETLINAHIAEWYGPNILDIELTIKP